MTKITVRYASIDHFSQTRSFSTLVAARRYAFKWLGEFPEVGSTYAVSGDGVGRITVSGVSIQELLHGELAQGGAFQVHVGHVNEDYAGVRFYLDRSFATFAEAGAYAQELDEEGCDGIRLVGTTEAAQAEIAAQQAAYEAQLYEDRQHEAYPF